MVTYTGNYANPFDVNLDGNIALGQMGIFSLDTDMTVPLPTVKMILEEGWNLVSLPVDAILNSSTLISTFSNARYLWKYSNNNWHFYSADAGLRTLAQSYGYTLFSQITPGEGFWIFNTHNEELNFNGNSYNLIQKPLFQNLLPQAWHLLGTGQSVSAETLVPEILWTYSQTSGWKIHTSNSELIATIEEKAIPRTNTITQGQGFWIYKK